jgi:hypothetical protein
MGWEMKGFKALFVLRDLSCLGVNREPREAGAGRTDGSKSTKEEQMSRSK